jgi:nicotinamide mononucleotide adenylyltransferase
MERKKMSRFELFLEMLHEARKDATGIYVGRFQGLTTGHAKVAKIMSRVHHKGYVLLVKGKKSSLDKERNPFPEKVQEQMISKVLGPGFKVIILHGSIVEEFKAAIEDGRIQGKEFVVYAGPDRVQDYRKLAKYFKQEGIGLSVVDAEQMVPRTEEISGTKFREALRNDDENAFHTVAPKELWSMFKELKKYVTS